MATQPKKCAWCSTELPNRKRKYCDECRKIATKKIARRSHVRTRKAVRLSDLSPEQAARRKLLQRKHHLKSTYGITLEQYQELLDKQGGCCGVCRKKAEDETKHLHVDHDHVSGEIRGLLCNYCNRRLVGRHRDGDLLRRIANYIEQGTGWFVPKKKRPIKRKPK